MFKSSEATVTRLDSIVIQLLSALSGPKQAMFERLSEARESFERERSAHSQQLQQYARQWP